MQIWNIQILLFVCGIQIFSIPNSILYLVFGDILKPNSIRDSYSVFKSICHILPKTQMSPKLKYLPNRNTIKTEMSLEPKCHWTDLSSKLKYHQNWNWIVQLGFQIGLQEFDTDCLCLVICFFSGRFFLIFFILTKGWHCLTPGIHQKVTHDYIFTRAPTLVGPWSFGHPFRTALTNISN